MLDLEAEDLVLSFTLLLTRQVKDRLQECAEILECSSKNEGNHACVLWSLCEISCKHALRGASGVKCLSIHSIEFMEDGS